MPVKPIREGYPTIIPYLMVNGAGPFVAFMVDVFGAKVVEQLIQADGKIGHTELRIGESMIMLGEASAARQATPVMLHLYVEDVDAAFARAVRAGAKILSPPTLQFYGDRAGGLIEPSGNTLWIATHVEDVAPDELRRRTAALNKN